MSVPPFGRPQPSRIPAVRSWTVGAGANAIETIDLGDIVDWTEDGVRAMAYAIANEEAERQDRLGNPAESVFVDGRQNKTIAQMQRTLTVVFGNDARPAMRAFELLVAEHVTPHVGVSWRWIVGNARGRERIVRAQIQKGGPVTLKLGETLYYVPRGPNEMKIAQRNIAYIESRGGRTIQPSAKQRARPAKRRARSRKGFMAETTQAARRSGTIRPEFSVTVIQSFKRARIAPPVMLWEPRLAAFIPRRIRGKDTNTIPRPLGRQDWTSRRTGFASFYQGAYAFAFRRSLR
ncbi:MAG: hypothetical protein ACE37J_12275 [Pikeienuella sp.]|uniref:hypothetical protein n=1 Tax=Pikeienuella sp. TaxID=2831957 RepID=UPI003918EA51